MYKYNVVVYFFRCYYSIMWFFAMNCNICLHVFPLFSNQLFFRFCMVISLSRLYFWHLKILCLPVLGVWHISHVPSSVIFILCSQNSDRSCPAKILLIIFISFPFKLIPLCHNSSLNSFWNSKIFFPFSLDTFLLLLLGLLNEHVS